MVRALLEASEMVVRYGDKMALDRVSLEIFPGETLARWFFWQWKINACTSVVATAPC